MVRDRRVSSHLGSTTYDPEEQARPVNLLKTGDLSREGINGATSSLTVAAISSRNTWAAQMAMFPGM